MAMRSRSARGPLSRLSLAAVAASLLAPVAAPAQFDALGKGLSPVAGANTPSAEVFVEGSRTLYAEPVADKAMVRLSRASALPGVSSTVANPRTGIALAEAESGAKAAGDLAKALAEEGSAAFVGPVYRVGARILGVGDTLTILFTDSTSAESVCAAEGLEIVRLEGDGFCVARLATSDGNDTIAAQRRLAGAKGVVAAAVDWYSLYELSNYTGDFGGTSSASPVVAGVAGLVLSANPDLTYAEAIEIINGTAENIDEANGQYVDGFSPFYGFGRVDADAAVLAALATVEPPTEGKIAPRGIAAPSDPGYPLQWHLDSTQTPEAVEAADIDAPEAWNLVATNPSMRISVIDSGTIMDHPDLNVVFGFDALTGDSTADPVGGGLEEHGTSVAGVIGARMNGKGVVGVAPGAAIIGVRAISGTSLIPITGSTIEESFRVSTLQGAWVINNSWGPVHDEDFCTEDDDFQDIPATFQELFGVNFAISSGRNGLGAVVVFAAGNSRALTDGYELHALPTVMAVAASNNLARRSIYSNYGESIDVCAPSNDFPIEFFECNDEIWTGGTLGITTTDASLLDLGGSSWDLGLGGIGVAGYRDVSQMLHVTDDAIGFGGYALSHPTFNVFFVDTLGVTVDEAGVIGGVLEYYVVDEFGNFTFVAQTPAVGKIRYSRKGTYLVNETTRNSLAISGKGTNRSGTYTFRTSGTETVAIKNGDIAYSGGFVQRTSASFAGEKVADTVVSLGADAAESSFYSPDISPAPTKAKGGAGSLTFGGTFRLLSEFQGTVNGTGAVTFRPLNLKPGTYQATASAAGYTATVSGIHRMFELSNFDFLQFYSTPLRASFRGPAASTNLVIPTE